MHVRYINFAIFNRGAELTLSNPWGLPPGFFSRGVGVVIARSPLVSRIGSGVRISASFQIFASTMLLHSAGFTSEGIFSMG